MGTPLLDPDIIDGTITGTLETADQIASSALVTAVPRTNSERWADRRAVAGKDFSVAADVGTDDAPAINAIMAAVAERGGGVVQLPPGVIRVDAPLLNCFSRVLVEGMGAEHWHDSAPVNGRSSVQIRASNLFEGEAVLIHSSPYGATNQKNYGGGFRYVEVFGGPTGLIVDSVSSGTYDVSVLSSTGDQAVLFKCGNSYSDLAETCDIQFANIRLSVRQVDGVAGTVPGVVFSGSTSANVCFCSNIVINVFYKDAIGFDAVSCDNNTFALIDLRRGESSLPLTGGSNFPCSHCGPSGRRRSKHDLLTKLY